MENENEIKAKQTRRGRKPYPFLFGTLNNVRAIII